MNLQASFSVSRLFFTYGKVFIDRRVQFKFTVVRAVLKSLHEETKFLLNQPIDI